jgi:membrane protease YdiL (CAAX protease family)
MEVRSLSFPIRSARQPVGAWVHAVEAGAIFALLISYIWFFQALARPSWMILLGIILISHAIRGETPSGLGLRKAGFAECARRFAVPVIVVAVITVMLGFVFETVRHVAVWQVAGVLLGYCPWALFQQYLLNGYFTNRLSASFDARYQFLVAPMAGGMFAAAHAPNMLLMSVTLIGGTLAALAYRRYRNLFILALAHALIGTTVWLAVPDSLSYHLRVGPGMLKLVHEREARRAVSPGGDSGRPSGLPDTRSTRAPNAP